QHRLLYAVGGQGVDAADEAGVHRIDVADDRVGALRDGDRFEVPREALELALVAVGLRVDLDGCAAAVQQQVLVQADAVGQEQVVQFQRIGNGQGVLVRPQAVQIGVHG